MGLPSVAESIVVKAVATTTDMQVLKEWLGYRNHPIIGRLASSEEVGHVQQTAQRTAATLLLGPDLDASYRPCATAHR